MNWGYIFSFNAVEPTLSMNNMYNHIDIFLDEVAPYKQLTKKEIELKSKPWITIYIQQIIPSVLQRIIKN